MIGRRRQYDVVIARPVVRAMTIAVVLLALGNLAALGCVIGWLRNVEASDAIRTALILFAAAACAQLAGGIVALFAWAWSR